MVLKSRLRCAILMISFLIDDISQYCLQILLAKADHPIASLPDENRVPRPFIDVMGARSLNSPDPFSQDNHRFNLHDQVHMILGAAYSAKMDSLGLVAVVLDVCVQLSLNPKGDEGMIVFAVAVHMQENLGEHMGRN